MNATIEATETVEVEEVAPELARAWHLMDMMSEWLNEYLAESGEVVLADVRAALLADEYLGEQAGRYGEVQVTEWLTQAIALHAENGPGYYTTEPGWAPPFLRCGACRALVPNGDTECSECGSTDLSTATMPETEAPQEAPAPNVQPVQDNAVLVDAKALSAALKIVKGSVARKTTLPVLNNVLIDSPQEGVLRVSGTNLEVSTSVTMLADVAGPLAITLPTRLLVDTIPNSGEVMLTTEYRTRTVHIEGSATATIKGISAEEYPILNFEGAELVAVLPLSLIKRAVKQVAFAASADASRPVLASVHMKIEDSGHVTFAAADGFRLARLFGKCSEDMPAPKRGEYLIPADSFRQLINLDSEHVQVSIAPEYNKITFQGHTVTVSSRLVDGQYVDIQRLIPMDFGTRWIAEVAEFQAVCKQLSPYAKDSAHIMRLEVEQTPYGEYGPSVLTASANAAEMGDCIKKIDIYCDGNGGLIALNLSYVQDILSAIAYTGKGQRVAVEMKTYQSPAVLRPVNADHDLLYVVMPMYLPNR